MDGKGNKVTEDRDKRKEKRIQKGRKLQKMGLYEKDTEKKQQEKEGTG